VSLPLLIFPCTIKSRSFLLAPAHPSGPGKRALNGCGGGGSGANQTVLQSFTEFGFSLEIFLLRNILNENPSSVKD